MPKKPVAKNSEADFVENILKALGSFFGWVFRKIFKKGANSAEFEAGRIALQEAWEQVELHLIENRGSLAISEADKILDAALKLVGSSGETMGERLKASEKRFSSDLYNRVWEAHKLRNKIAHEIGFEVSMDKAIDAVGVFRGALVQLNIYI